MQNLTDTAQDLARRGLVQLVVRTLSPAGIPVMPLKGVLFAYWIYPNPYGRLTGDIDLIVPYQQLGPALNLLEDQGFSLKPAHANPNERTLLASGFPIEIDLHRSLFAPGYYRLSTQELFARGTRNEDMYDCPVILPNPYDAYAHVIGHAACAHFPKLDPRIWSDLTLLASVFSLDPHICAGHLYRTGLARAARYTVGLMDPPEGFSDAVLQALPSDPIGAGLSALARVLTQSFQEKNPAARMAAHLVNSSIAKSAYSGMYMGIRHWKMGRRYKWESPTP